MENKLTKSIIVTGASSGIGKATVIKLVESGYQVFGLARRYDKLLSIVPTELLSKEKNQELYVPIKFDITTPETFNDVLHTIFSKSIGNTIYGLVNNAGYVEPGAIEDITMNNLRIQFETNFFGLVGFTKKVLPLMMQQNKAEGRILNVSSLAGLISLPLIGAYAATKHALEAVSDALRIELWNTNIRIITINPGVVETNIYDVLKAKLDYMVKDNVNQSRFIAAYNKYFTKQNYPGIKSSLVADVICGAISASNPKQRYIIGSVKEKLAVRLRPLVPDRLFNSLLAKQIRN